MAIDFLIKAGTPLNMDEGKHVMYDLLLWLTDQPIDIWDKFLTENGFSQLKAIE